MPNLLEYITWIKNTIVEISTQINNSPQKPNPNFEEQYESTKLEQNFQKIVECFGF